MSSAFELKDSNAMALKNAKILRELSESVLKTLTQLEPTANSNENPQYRELLASRCRELKEYVDAHPVESIAAVSANQFDISSSGSTSELFRSLSTTDANKSKRSVSSSSGGDKAPRYKTEMCRSVSESGGVCRYGDKCQYAHSKEELRPQQRHPRYKTQLCREYHLTSVCSYGVRCNFLHDEYKQPSTSDDVFTPGNWSGRSTPDLEVSLQRWRDSSDRLSLDGSGNVSPSAEHPIPSPVMMLNPMYSFVGEPNLPAILPQPQVLVPSQVSQTPSHKTSQNVFQYSPYCGVPTGSTLTPASFYHRPLYG